MFSKIVNIFSIIAVQFYVFITGNIFLFKGAFGVDV